MGGEFLAGGCCDGGQRGAAEMGREEYRRGSTSRGRRRSSAVSRALSARSLSAAPPQPPPGGQSQPQGVQSEGACRPPWATAPQQGLCALRPRQCVLASTAPPSEGAPAREGALLGQMPNGGYFHVPLTPTPGSPGGGGLGLPLLKAVRFHLSRDQAETTASLYS